MRAVQLLLYAFLLRGLGLVCLFSPRIVGGFHCFLLDLVTLRYKKRYDHCSEYGDKNCHTIEAQQTKRHANTPNALLELKLYGDTILEGL
jgi:hypothetical protein